MKIATRIGRLFSTPESWDLYEHLTPEERQKLDDMNQEMAMQYRRWLAPGFICCVVLIACGASFRLPWLLWASIALTVAFFFFFERPFHRKWNSRMREMLASSQYGKSKGAEANHIRLVRFPGFG